MRQPQEKSPQLAVDLLLEQLRREGSTAKLHDVLLSELEDPEIFERGVSPRTSSAPRPPRPREPARRG
jgi:hypothetical protein